MKAFLKQARFYLRNYAFLASIVSLLFASIKMYYWEPPANVVLDFNANLLGWLRPDFGISEDLKSLGWEEPNESIIGITNYDVLAGVLQNKGDKDCNHLELKSTVEGSLRIARVTGWPDHPKIISKDEAVVRPDQYVPLGSLRVDDPPYFLSLFCGTSQLKKVTFRYKEDGVTNTVTYIVKRDSATGRARIVREAFWGMDAVEIKQFAWKSGVGVVILGTVGFWQRVRILGAIVYFWKIFVSVIGSGWNHLVKAFSVPPPHVALWEPPTKTGKSRKQEIRNRPNKNRNKKRRQNEI